MIEFNRVVVEVFGGCNYTCNMCPHTTTGREKSFLRKMPLDLFTNILDQVKGKPVINLEGSGEATLAPDLPLYIEECSKRGFRPFIYSNGSKMNGDFMRDCVDAGLSLYRFSVIGYNREKYKQWMGIDNWDLIYQNTCEMRDYIKQSGSDCRLDSYHLLLDPTRVEYEVAQYQQNFIFPIGTEAFIWKQHNWSGNYSPEYTRNDKKRRTCGRPFANEITFRAGGLNGLQGAVTPCCQTLGPPNESASVLGHASSQTIEQIYYGNEYNKLRKAHEMEDWDAVPYCKDCDFLYDDPEVLVWSNSPTAKVGQMIGVENMELNS